MPGAGTNLVTDGGFIPSPQIAQVGITSSSVTSGPVGNTLIWTAWNNTYVLTTSSTVSTTTMINTTTNSAVWGAWNVQFTTSSVNVTPTIVNATMTVNNQIIWGAWNASLSNMRQATAEEVARAQEQSRRYQEQQVRVQAERSLAEKRAEKLLQQNLNAKQREELAANGFFTLETIGKDGQRRMYRIKRGRSGNIEQVDASGRRLKRLCAHPVEQVPDADTMLGQKLLLETEEEEFLRIANHS